MALGGYVYAIHLRTRSMLEAGDIIKAGRGRAFPDAYGLMEPGHTFYRGPPLCLGRDPLECYPGDLASARRDMVLDMIVSAAGPIAEGIYTDTDLCDVFAFGGEGDEKEIDEYADALAAMYKAIPLEQRRGIATSNASLWREVVTKAEKLVRREWHKIIAVADLIQPNAYTDGDEVTALFESLALPLAA
jgi:hypothetical protein